jgi:hypothetical protein
MQKQRGLKEVIDFPQETSNALNEITDKETLDILAVNNNIAAVTDDFQNCENSGLDIGRDYDWGKRQHKVRFMNQMIIYFLNFFLIHYVHTFFCIQTPDNGAFWLQESINQYNEKKNCTLRIPQGKNNQEFLLKNLNNDQFRIAYIILSKIREWINLEKAPLHSKKKFKPL